METEEAGSTHGNETFQQLAKMVQVSMDPVSALKNHGKWWLHARRHLYPKIYM